MNPALFLDRDGVIIENLPGYVKSTAEVHFLPGVLQALARIRGWKYSIIIITNQSAVGRGIISIQTAEEINQSVVAAIQSHGGRIDGVFMCPHHPDAGCNCRKPLPGLFFQAANRLNIDLANSIMIGDALTDLQAGQRAGLKHLVLVRTGRGLLFDKNRELRAFSNLKVCDSLVNALDCLDQQFHLARETSTETIPN